MFLALILVSLGCILYQQIGNNVPLIAYYANIIREYQQKVKKKKKLSRSYHNWLIVITQETYMGLSTAACVRMLIRKTYGHHDDPDDMAGAGLAVWTLWSQPWPWSWEYT